MSWSLVCDAYTCHWQTISGACHCMTLHLAQFHAVLQVTELNVTTPSNVPPSFVVTAVGNYTEGNAVLTVSTNETAIVYYMVLLGQATSIPTAAQVCEPAVHISACYCFVSVYASEQPACQPTHAMLVQKCMSNFTFLPLTGRGASPPMSVQCISRPTLPGDSSLAAAEQTDLLPTCTLHTLQKLA